MGVEGIAVAVFEICKVCEVPVNVGINGRNFDFTENANRLLNIDKCQISVFIKQQHFFPYYLSPFACIFFLSATLRGMIVTGPMQKFLPLRVFFCFCFFYFILFFFFFVVVFVCFFCFSKAKVFTTARFFVVFYLFIYLFIFCLFVFCCCFFFVFLFVCFFLFFKSFVNFLHS